MLFWQLTKEHLILENKIKGAVKNNLFFYSSSFLGKNAQNKQTEPKLSEALFWAPEGVQRYVEWRSLFIA